MRRRVLSLGLLALLTVAGGGCGWTMRDEFYASRGVTIPAASGDRSMLVMGPRQRDQARADDLNVARR